MEVYGVILTLLRSIVAVWDFVTWPIYQAVYYWKIYNLRTPTRIFVLRTYFGLAPE